MAALAAAIAVHVALLATPRPERPAEPPAEPRAPIDGLDFELEEPAAPSTPANGTPAAPSSLAPTAGTADAPKAVGRVASIKKAQAPAAKSTATTPDANAKSTATTPDTAAKSTATTPDTAAKSAATTPDAASRTPEVASRTPDATTGTSEDASRTPDATTGTPEVESKTPEATAATPEVASRTPDATTGTSEDASRTPEVAAAPSDAIAEGPPGDEYGGPPSGDGALAPGLGAPVWALPGVLPSAAPPRPAPTAAPALRPVDPAIAGKVLSGTMHSKDKSAGIEVPAAGLVATTLANVVRASAAPLDARATFEVKLGEGGQVLGVRLVSASAGSAPTWDGIVDAAKGALAGRALQMGPQKEPVTVTVKVQSKVQLPSGSKKKPTPEFVCAEEVLAKLQEAIDDLSQTGALRDPSGAAQVDLDEERKRRFCIPLGLQVRGDLSDIGAHMVNVVSATFTVKREGERTLPHEEILPIDTRVPWAPPDPKKMKKPPLPKKPKKKKKSR